MLGSKKVDAGSFSASNRLRHIARFGVGYDSINIAHCTEAGVLVTNTPLAVQRPMAYAVLAMLMALAHNIVQKDRIARSGDWAEKSEWRGVGLDRSRIGIIGFGGIGQEVARALRLLGLEVVVSNRSDKSEEAAAIGARQLPFEELLATSDFIIPVVPANAATFHLIGEAELKTMKPTARLINLARGSIVDEQALIVALRDETIAGAGLDVFEREPLPADHPLTTLNNVILSPHSLCWTDSFVSDVATSAIEAIIDVSQGRLPAHLINSEAALGEKVLGTSGNRA
jgi:phosphoglycerate dehydrogenase-like enzyme